MADEQHKQELKDKISEEKFGKSFEDLNTHQKRVVGGSVGAEILRERSASMKDDEEEPEPDAATKGRSPTSARGAKATAQHLRDHKDERKEELAQEKYGKNYDDLSTHEKRSVAGFVGHEIRRAG